MNFGRFRDGYPRLTLSLPGRNGVVQIEFIVDTGFEGELALPLTLINRLDAEPGDVLRHQMADGTQNMYPVFTLVLEWNDEERTIEVVGLGSTPLLGTRFLDGQHFHAEMTEGGEIVVEPL